MQFGIVEIHYLELDNITGAVRTQNNRSPVTMYRQDVAYNKKMEIDCLYHGLKFIRDNSMEFGGIEWYYDGQFKGAFYHEDFTESKRVMVKRVDEEVEIKYDNTQQEN